MQRAYAVLEIKGIDDDSGIIEGMATTPATDRMGDIVEPEGAEFKLPIPLLWQHDAKQPIGHVIAAKVTKAGISIKAKVIKGVLPEIDRAWSLIKGGLVRGLSIGFRATETADIKDSYGVRFTKWEWLELSAVTIPANSEASIQTIKSCDQEQLAASGNKAAPVVRLTNPGASGKHKPTPKPEDTMKTIQEQIAAFEARRKLAQDNADAIMQKSAEEGRTLEEAEKQEYDGFDAEVKSVSEHIERLVKHESRMKATAVPVAGKSPESAAESRSPIISVRPNCPAGTGFTRYAMALLKANGNRGEALAIAQAQKHWMDQTPEVATVLRAAVAAGTTTDATWAAPLAEYQNLSSEFIELLRPQTIIGKISNFRRVPFNVRMPRQTTGVSAGWVGEGLPKPVQAPAFDTFSLGEFKVSVIVVITEELLRFSNPAAEAVVRQDMLAGVATYLDRQFILPSVAAVANVNPASVTNGVTARNSTGITKAQVDADVKVALGQFTNGDIPLSGAVWIMHPTTALALSMVLTATSDQVAYPGININGGTFFGLPVITSTAVGTDTNQERFIALVQPSEIFLADDGQITLDVSREASLQMNDAPSAGAQSLVSLWQNNMVGLRAERFVNWQKRRTDAVAVIDDVAY